MGNLNQRFSATIQLLILSLSVVGCLASERDHIIYDGEEQVLVTGKYGTVAEVVIAADIVLRPEDAITPVLTTTIAAGTAITIHRAQPVLLHTEQGSETLWTHQTTLAAFLSEAGIAADGTTAITADGQPIGIGQLATRPLPSVVEIGRFHTVTIHHNNQQQTIRTAVVTVGEAIQEAGIMLFAADRIEPAAATPLETGMIINIVPSTTFNIHVDGRTQHIRSNHTNPHAILAEAGITLQGDDYTIPDPSIPLQANDTIQVIRVKEEVRFEDGAIPYQTLWQATEQLDLDTQGIITQGVPGILRHRWRVRYENGVEVGQIADGEWVEREPVNEVIGYGTRITVHTLDTPEGQLSYWRVVRMRVTSYTAASSGKTADDPAYGITASGRRVAKGIVAVDRSVVPFRSSVYVPNYGTGFVGDTGGGVRGRWIDLGYGEDDFVSWSGYVDVYYLTPVPEPADINYLLPTALP